MYHNIKFCHPILAISLKISLNLKAAVNSPLWYTICDTAMKLIGITINAYIKAIKMRNSPVNTLKNVLRFIGALDKISGKIDKAAINTNKSAGII